MTRKTKDVVFYELVRPNRVRTRLSTKLKRVFTKKREKKVSKPSNNEVAFKLSNKSKSSRPLNCGLLREVLLKSKLKGRVKRFLNPSRLIPMLAVVLVGLLVIKFYQHYFESAADQPDAQVVNNRADPAGGFQPMPEQGGLDTKKGDQEVMSRPAGDHVIVIMTYRLRKDLEPVKDYFADNGIATNIEKQGDYYCLLTAERFKSPKQRGSDGFYALEKIKKIGANYKAPSGYETFGAEPFQDAYGMKISKENI
ncbi:MAG: hypothetical protein JW912_00125 [Sedimentisphaerales bacterium]|nr:hypothetical protein [Sedimentisphaerales bacterium]